MPIAKPHRTAVLLPELHTGDADRAHRPELELLLWLACADHAARHPNLAVLAPEAMALRPLGGSFVPLRARRGHDQERNLFERDRRDDLVWLEMTVEPGRSGVVRLHVASRDGSQRSWDALGSDLTGQVNQVFTAWLAELGFAPLPVPFAALDAEAVLGAARALAPPLRAAAAPSFTVTPGPSGPSLRLVEDTGDADAAAGDDGEGADGDALNDNDAADEVAAIQFSGAEAVERAPAAARPPLAEVAAGLPPTLKTAALRALGAARGEEVSSLIAELDPEHPLAFASSEPDHACLRRARAAAPGAVAPYLAFAHDPNDDGPDAPTPLEAAASAGLAAFLAPADHDVLDRVGRRLRRLGLGELSLRLGQRDVALDYDRSATHLTLLDFYPDSERIGAWLLQSHMSSARHGCPMEPYLPWFNDQILVDLAAATSLMNAGRLDEAIALRANRLEGREAHWPRHTRILERWRKDPRFVAWCYAREGFFRGEDGRVVEGFGRIEPDDGVDVAMFLDGLVATGREHEVPLAWAHFGRGRGFASPLSRLAAGRALTAAGHWRAALEELVRVELGAPLHDHHVALAHALRTLAAAPIDQLEPVVAQALDAGARTLARAFARDLADFAPGVEWSVPVTWALAGAEPTAFEASWLSTWSTQTRSREAVDALFAEVIGGRGTAQKRADVLVNRWNQVVFVGASPEDAPGLAQATAYVAAQALARYLAATTQRPSPLAGGLRTVAAEALAALAPLRHALAEGDLRSLLATLEPVVGVAEPLLVDRWLAYLERSLRLDERFGGDLGALIAPTPAVAGRLLAPEDLAVMAWRGAELVREKPSGWAAEAAPWLGRVAWHTGGTGADEWAEAVEASGEAHLDALLSAAWLARGDSAAPTLRAARALFALGRADAAYEVLCTGLGAVYDAFRDPRVAALEATWTAAGLDVPFAFRAVATGVFEALQQGDGPTAVRYGRWALGLDANNAEGHRNVGLAYAYMGQVVPAMEHFVRATPDQGTQLLSGVLYQSGHIAEAMAVLDYASRWYVRADQWLTYGGVAYGAMDNPRTIKAYGLAYQLDPDAFDASMLNAYAGVLDEVGDYDMCERIAQHMLSVSGDDIMWLTNGWHHLACAYLGQGRFDEALEHASRAAEHNPLPDNAPVFAQTLAKAQARQRSEAPPMEPTEPQREPVFAIVETGDLTEAASHLDDPSWRVKRAALRASRYRFGSESRVPVTPRAREAAERVLAESAGTTDPDAALTRAFALELRAQAIGPRDPVPFLGDRMTRDAFYQEFRARGGVVLGEAPKPQPDFVDREVFAGGRLANASDYVALLRDLATLAPADALARHGLDDAAYVDAATEWGARLDEDPELAATIEAGLDR